MEIPRRRDNEQEVTWEKQETLWVKETGSASLAREKLVRPDGSQVLATTVFANENSHPTLLIDPRFLEKPIFTEPGGLLIDQNATKQAWVSPAGLKPEEFLSLSTVPENAIGIPPTNAGWQYGAFWIKEGRIISLPGDSSLSGEFEIIARKRGAWKASSLNLNGGNPQEDIGNVEIGLSLPLIVKDGQTVPQMSIWERGDPRALADPRNWVDMAAGQKTTSDFWRLVRKFMPVTSSAARRVTQEGRYAVIRVANIESQDVDAFQNAIMDANLENHWRIVQEKDNNVTRAVVCAILPPTKLPAVGIGHDKEGRLIVTVVDGRQKESSGATIDELAQIMKAKGAINAGFGSAGGDASVISKTSGGMEILNSPSNVDSQTGQRVTRLVPSLLVIS